MAHARQSLVDVALDRAGVVGLHVDRAERRARRLVAEPLDERFDRRRERQLDGCEAPALVDRACVAVRREHLELECAHALRTQLLCNFADELVRDALATRLGAHVEDVEHADALTGLRGDGEADVVGEQDDVLADCLLEFAEVVLGVVVAPRRLGKLPFERVPELAHEREIVSGCGTNHGARCASNR